MGRIILTLFFLLLLVSAPQAHARQDAHALQSPILLSETASPILSQDLLLFETASLAETDPFSSVYRLRRARLVAALEELASITGGGAAAASGASSPREKGHSPNVHANAQPVNLAPIWLASMLSGGSAWWSSSMLSSSPSSWPSSQLEPIVSCASFASQSAGNSADSTSPNASAFLLNALFRVTIINGDKRTFALSVAAATTASGSVCSSDPNFFADAPLQTSAVDSCGGTRGSIGWSTSSLSAGVAAADAMLTPDEVAARAQEEADVVATNASGADTEHTMVMECTEASRKKKDSRQKSRPISRVFFFCLKITRRAYALHACTLARPHARSRTPPPATLMHAYACIRMHARTLARSVAG